MPSQVGSGRFRSMSVGEWLDATFTMYRRNFALIASISAVVQIPYALLTWLLFELTGVATFVRSPFASLGTRTLTQAQAQQLLNSALGAVAVSVGLLLVSVLIVVPLGEAATTRAVSDRYLDRPSSLMSAYRAALGRLRSLIAMILILIVAYAGSLAVVFALVLLLSALGAGGLGVLLAVLAFIALIPVLIMIYVRTVVAVPAIVLERVSGWRGLQRSWQLISGRFWPTFGRMALLGLIAAIISSVVAAIFEIPGAVIDPNNTFVFDQVASALAAVFVGPITYVGVTLLYYDIRIRKEGFDIEMLARSL
jgi:Membrane domain of glycerophosphoryl diester phosphodiesterase